MTSSSIQNHQEALKAKHAALEAAIREEECRPHPDDEALHALKVRKLHLKEDIEGIGHH